MNQLILGDNLEILKKLNSESVDLIYLDPPFFSNRNYEVIWGDTGEVRSFQDRWRGEINIDGFDYDEAKNKGLKPEILLDKTGTQTRKFKPSQHTVAVKVVENDGLENVEVIRIKVNGVVTRN